MTGDDIRCRLDDLGVTMARESIPWNLDNIEVLVAGGYVP